MKVTIEFFSTEKVKKHKYETAICYTHGITLQFQVVSTAFKIFISSGDKFIKSVSENLCQSVDIKVVSFAV